MSELPLPQAVPETVGLATAGLTRLGGFFAARSNAAACLEPLRWSRGAARSLISKVLDIANPRAVRRWRGTASFVSTR